MSSLVDTVVVGPERDPRERQAELLLAGIMVIWAVNAPAAKEGLAHIDPFVFNSIRYVVAFVVLMAMRKRWTAWVRVAPEDRWAFLRLGSLVSIIYQVVFIVALSLTTAANTAVLMSTSPLWTAVLSTGMHRERLRATTVGAMILSLAGIVLVIVGSGVSLEFGGAAVWGDLLALTGAVLWALNTNLQKPLLLRYPPLEVTVIAVGIGAVGLTVVAVPSMILSDWSKVTLGAAVIAVLSGALSIAVANVIWSLGVKRLGPRRTANFNNLVPVLTFLLAVLVFGEPVSTMQVGGAAMTVAGVWWARA